MTLTVEEIRQQIEEKHIDFLRLMFTDLLGQLKNIEVPSEQLEKILDKEQMIDGSSIAGFVGIDNSDLFLYPDIDTWIVFPWGDQSGRVGGFICDVYNPDGTPFSGDPRGNLKRNLSKMSELGFASLNLGPEPEFFLLKTDENGVPLLVPNDHATYFDLAPTDVADVTRREIVQVLKKLNFHIEASHHEVAIGQHEVDFRYDEAVKACDNIQLFKLVVKEIASLHGLYATFMAKPIFGINGSGMHFNMSLFNNDGSNAFYDKNGHLQLSTVAHEYIGGMIKHAYHFAGIINPTVNSYKRLVPGYEAPIYVAWGAHNRTPLIRIPSSRGMGTRAELRAVDPMANPYMALAVVLAAGLDGVKNHIAAPDPVESNIYNMSKEELKAAQITEIPENLKQAVEAIGEDLVIVEALGEHLYNAFVEEKLAEWKEYVKTVSEWEINKYLPLY